MAFPGQGRGSPPGGGPVVRPRNGGKTPDVGDDLTVLRQRLVDQLVVQGYLRTERIERAFRQVPRHLFLPALNPAEAYQDRAIPTKWQGDGLPISSSSQPAIMAEMLEQLAVEPGQRVLEVGAGTGYNAALLARLAGPSGTVTTIDIDQDTVDQAREHLRSAGAPGVHVVCADGSEGWPDGGPYDRIIVTAAAGDLPPAWFAQLTEDGRLVLPLALRGVQRSVAFVRRADHLVSASIVECGFMPLRGESAGALDRSHAFPDVPGLFVSLASGRPVDTAGLYAALQQPGQDRATGVRVRQQDLWGGLGLWLAVHEPDVGRLVALGSAAEAPLVAPLLASAAVAATTVLVGKRSLAVLVGPADPDDRASPVGFPLAVRPFGPEGSLLARRLTTLVRGWDEAGRPSTSSLRIRAYPASQEGAATAACVLTAGHTRLLLDW